MARTLDISYEPWDPKKDVPLERAGTQLGLAVIQGNLAVGRARTVREGRRDSLIGPSLEGVIGVLAGAVEWLRAYGLTPEEVKAQMTAYMERNRGSREQQILKGLYREIENISDPKNQLRKVDKTVVYQETFR